MTWLSQVKFDENGLIPVIAQDHHTGKILMMAWANREALQLTIEKKQAIYWSRSRQKLWHKGETSGHFQQVHEIRLDCDGDVIVLKITQIGNIACHTGRQSCFYQLLTNQQGQLEWVITDDVLKDPAVIYQNLTPNHTSTDILTSLNAVLQQRKNANPNDSYVASLYHKGLNKILEKVGEEATEAIIAAKELQWQSDEKNQHDLVYEIADVWFHTMVTLAWFDLPVGLVQQELARRFGLSGIAEKANR